MVAPHLASTNAGRRRPYLAAATGAPALLFGGCSSAPALIVPVLPRLRVVQDPHVTGYCSASSGVLASPNVTKASGNATRVHAGGSSHVTRSGARRVRTMAK
jgi:hypothetical protein